VKKLIFIWLNTVKSVQLEPAFVFGRDRCLVYSGLIYNDFLHWDFIWSTAYGGFCFTQGLGLSRFHCTQMFCLG
jgi:hypothetical protein